MFSVELIRNDQPGKKQGCLASICIRKRSFLSHWLTLLMFCNLLFKLPAAPSASKRALKSTEANDNLLLFWDKCKFVAAAAVPCTRFLTLTIGVSGAHSSRVFLQYNDGWKVRDLSFSRQWKWTNYAEPWIRDDISWSCGCSSGKFVVLFGVLSRGIKLTPEV